MRSYPNGLTAHQIRDLVGECPTMLEIGSHDGSKDGSHTLLFLEAMPGIQLYCFEPDSRPIARFKETIGDDPRVRLCEAAVAGIDGEGPFHASTGKAGHMADWDFSGSIHKPTGHLEKSPEIRFKPPVDVPYIRLDTWLDATLSSKTIIDFIWADTQAAEGDMITGGQETLRRTRYLYTEFYNRPMYEGQLKLTEVHWILPGGTDTWELIGIYGGENALFKNGNVQR